MSNYYVALGPYETGEIAWRARCALTESDALRARIIRLRPKGQSLAARLAAVEAVIGEPACFGCGKSRAEHPADPANSDCAFPTIAEHLEHLTREHAALVQRVGDLETLPASPAAEPTKPCAKCGTEDEYRLDFALCGYCAPEPRLPASPEEVSAEVASAPEPTHLPSAAEVARVGAVVPFEDAAPAEPTDEELATRAKALFDTVDGRYMYNLGREHGRADADAAMDLLRGKLSAAREEIARLKAATPARDPLRDPRPTATQPTEAEMAAELRAAGWRQGQVSGHWYMRPSSEPHTTADAYATMRAGKVAT